MQIIGAELLEIRTGTETLKFILNEKVMLLFYPTNEHRNVRIDGTFYEDDSKGNAVAGLIMESRVEIRLHRGFSIERIRSLWEVAVTQGTAKALKGMPVQYGATLL